MHTRYLQQARNWSRYVPDLDALAVLPILTVVLLLLNAQEVWYLAIPLVIWSVVGLAYAQLLRTTQYWFVMATLLGAAVYFHWDTADNHQYLFVYWCLALCAAFSLPRMDQLPALAVSSRWLLGLCMLLATCWKLATPNYIDGTFFEYSLLTDERFADVAHLLGGLKVQALRDNGELVAAVGEGYVKGWDASAVRLASTDGVAWLAWILTWWTVFIEGLLGVLFLLPDRPWTSRLRNSALIIFAVTTYSVAHVRGFGWMLMLLGLAQCRPDEKRWRFAYLAAFILIQLYFLPFVAIGTALFR